PELLVQVPGASRDFSTTINGTPVHFMAAPNRFRATTLFYLDARSIARKILALKPDLVHAHGVEDAYGLAAQRTGLPYILTAQGLHFLINRRVNPQLVSRARVVEFTEWRCLRRAQHVIAKSE